MPAPTWLPKVSDTAVMVITTTRANSFRCCRPILRSWEIGIEILSQRRAKVATVLVLVTCIDYVFNGFVLLTLVHSLLDKYVTYLPTPGP